MQKQTTFAEAIATRYPEQVAIVVSFPSESQETETLLFGTKSGRDGDKLTDSGIRTESARSVDCVLLSSAVANFECTLSGELETGDHFIFAGTVICSHRNSGDLNRIYTIGKGYKMAGIKPVFYEE